MLDTMLKEAARGRFDVVMVWAMDRLGRSLADLIDTFRTLEASHVDLFLHHEGMIRPAHGAGMLRPWRPGQTGNPGGLGGKYAEARRALRDLCCDRGVERLVELAESADERVATTVTLGMWERAFGKPKEYDPREDSRPVLVDLTRLTTAQLNLLRTMIDSGAIRPTTSDMDEARKEQSADR